MTRTLADMTPDEWQKCVGRWAEVRRHLVIVTEIYERDGDAAVFRPETQNIEWYILPDVTPRLDLPRAWTPDGKPVPGTWDDDNGHNYMRRFQSEWEWKHDTPQHIIDQHTKETP